ncbi:MAG: thioredoxin-disulfide reductase [Deltaproteobacteria bacterium]|nr:thioredoxin-disulfide reductase [Deltaproteobacteria bacterium]
MSDNNYDFVTIGGGPAGLTAAIYAGRGMLKTLVIEKLMVGGQATITHMIDNYPGFPEGVTGPDLMEKFELQAKRFGAEFKFSTVDEIKMDGNMKVLKLGNEEIRAKTVLICTGAEPRRLNVPGETKLTGKGVSYCATCDGAFFRDAVVAVVGGGDSAVKEAIYLTKFASKVYVIHRRDELRAEKITAEQAFANEKIDFVWDSVVEEVKGDHAVKSLQIKNVKDGSASELEVEGAFIYVGMIPNTDFLNGFVELDDGGYIIADHDTHTKVTGVFAAGDVRRKLSRQVATAVGDGATAAMAAEECISGHCFE